MSSIKVLEQSVNVGEGNGTFFDECLKLFEEGSEQYNRIQQHREALTNDDMGTEFYALRQPPPGFTPIDFMQEVIAAQSGELRKYPLDDATIMAFNITVEELSPYVEGEKAVEEEKGEIKHWAITLHEILQQRRARLGLLHA